MLVSILASFLERKAFPCYDLALSSIERGENYPCALNGAGEVAVCAFLDGQIPFLAIPQTMEYALEKTERLSALSFENLKETDERARALAWEYIKKNPQN